MSFGEAMKAIKGLNIKEMKQKAQQAEERQKADHTMIKYLVRISLNKNQKEAFMKMMKELGK